MSWLKRKRIWVAGGVVVAAPALAIGLWLGLPLVIDKTVIEEFPFAHAATIPSDMTMEEVNQVMETIAKVDAPMEEAMPEAMGEATALKRGDFADADSFHKGEGTATIYRLPDGSHVLRVESLRVSNGPDLRVILTTHPNPEGRDDVHQTGYVELGKLKGNIGDQNYPVPPEVAPTSFNAVVIYCKPFHVIFSVAPLQ